MVSFNYSLIPSFDFKKACFICGEAFTAQPDKTDKDILIGQKKNPRTLFKTVYRDKSKGENNGKSFKEVLQHVNPQFFRIQFSLFLQSIFQ